MKNNESMVSVTEIHTSPEGIAEAGAQLAKLTRLIGPMFRATEDITGKAAELGMDIEKVIADTEKALHIGAAVCMFTANIMGGDEHEDAEDAAEGAAR